MRELYHHGVKGQKWGVRRYQNKNGSLTSAGKKRTRNNRSTRSETVLELPKGTVMYRSVRNGSKQFMKRGYTYVNITDEWNTHSEHVSSGFDGAFDTDFKIKTKRSLKIATSSDYFNAVMKSNGIDPNIYLNKVPKSVVDKGKYVVENRLLDHKYREATGGQYEASNKAFKYLSKKGFDGVIDPVDGARQEREEGTAMSTVIFNPRRNLKIVEEYKFGD